MELLALVVALAALGLALWRGLVRPRLPPPGEPVEPPTDAREGWVLLGAFVLAWIANGVLLFVLAGWFAPDADEGAATPAE